MNLISPPRALAHLLAAGALLALAACGGGGDAAELAETSTAAPAETQAQALAARTTALATPTKIVVSNVTSSAFTLNIGGSTQKLYTVSLNGQPPNGFNYSSASVGYTISGLAQNTVYSVTVREIKIPGGQQSAASAPVVVRTAVYVAPVAPGAPSQVRVAPIGTDRLSVSWVAPSGGAASYRIYINGEAGPGLTTTETSLSFQATTLANSGQFSGLVLRTGRNRIGVEAVNAAGVSSPVSDIDYIAAGNGPASPTAPTNLQTTTVSSNRIGLAWSPSIDPAPANVGIYYRLYVDGRFKFYTCSTFCFGLTGGAATGLAPGTSYRLGIEAQGEGGGFSTITEITATTATP